MSQALMFQIFEMVDAHCYELLQKQGGRITPHERIELFNMLSEHYEQRAETEEAQLARKETK